MSLQVPEPAGRPASLSSGRRRVARAAVSPSAAIVTAAGAGIGLLADPHTAILAIILGVGAWMGRVGVAMFGAWHRGLPTVDIDPWAVPEPWRQYVNQALNARLRFDRTLAGWPPGPLRDRLIRIQPQLERGAQEVWAVARLGATLSGPVSGVTAASPSRPSAGQLAIELLDRLRVLTSRLDDAVTQLLSLGLERERRESDVSTEPVLGSIDSLIEEITALHEGLRNAGAESAGSSPSDEGPTIAIGGQPPPSPPTS